MGEEAKRGRRRAGPARVTARSLENAALHYLERFSSSSAHLRQVLMRRVQRSARAHGTDPAEGAALIDALIARYQQAGLLDDARYAAQQASSLRRRGASGRGIRGRLAQKGVARDLVETAIAALEHEEGTGDLAAACAFIRRRRLGPYRPEASRAAFRQKDLAALARAGFPLDLARRVLDAPDPEALATLTAAEE